MAERSPFRLPAKILIRRLDLGIEAFFEEIVRFAKPFGIDLPSPKRKEDTWLHPDFVLAIMHKRLDKTPSTFEFTLRRIPGFIKIRNGSISTKTNHKFSFNIPRSYPHDLEKIKINCNTPLYHPRISDGINLPVCYIVNGEIDRILLDIVFNVLMRPDLIRPPSIYADSDWGYNSIAMKWYLSLIHI